MGLQSQHPSQRRTDEVMKLLLNPSINSGQAHRLHVLPLWVFRYDFIKIYKRINSPLFLWSVLLGFLSCFPSLLGINTLTHTISFYRNLNFGYRQDTTQAVLVCQKLESYASCPFCNIGIFRLRKHSLSNFLELRIPLR